MSLSRSLLVVVLVLGLPPGVGAAVGPPLPAAGGAPLPPFARARLGTLGWRNTSTVGAIAVAPDGKRLATGDREGNVRLWEVPGGRELRRWQFRKAWVYT